MVRSRWLLGCLLLAALPCVAQEKKEPAAIAVPRGFRMYLVSDGRFDLKNENNRVGKLHDPVTAYGLYTTIGVFVRGVPTKADDPAIEVLKKEQELAAKWRDYRLGAFMAFLTLTKDFNADDDRDTRITEISNLAKGANAPLVSVGMAEATLEGGGVPPQVEAWKLGEEDVITIVLYHRFKEVKRWSFKMDAPPTAADLDALAKEVNGVLGRKK